MADAKTRLANRERQKRYREAHKDEINEQRKERYSNRIKKGKCPRCGGKVKSGHTLCADCCEYQANLNRKYAKIKKKTTGKTTAASKKATAKKTAVKKPAKTKKTVKAKPPAAKKPVKPKAKK